MTVESASEQQQLPSPGRVYLVGAGPGDPRLITVRGRECLEQADVVLCDRLVPDELLAYIPETAQVIDVSKLPGDHTLSQEETNKLMVERAKAGNTVVRLKGGDPFLFGRGGEEALYLLAHEIPFEIVPGVPSAVAAPAYAGIPVTHRGVASSVAFVTGHEAVGKESDSVDWEQLARGVDTIVILMGVKNFPEIAERLLAAGLSPQTPVSFIEQGTTADQRTVSSELATAAEAAELANISAPAVIVVGQVAELGESLAWFEKLPLLGKRIIVTRPLAQSRQVCERLRELGADPVEIPTVRIVPPGDFDELDQALRGAGDFDWLVFTSANGVWAVASRLQELELDIRALAGPRIAAVGSETEAALRQLALRVDLVPATFTTEALAQELVSRGVTDKSILIPRSAQAPDGLAIHLAEAGAKVSVVPAYQTIPELEQANDVRGLLQSGKLDAITFTSSSCVSGFMSAMNGCDVPTLLGDMVVACIGPVTAATARDFGLTVATVAENSTAAGLVDALIRVFDSTAAQTGSGPA